MAQSRTERARGFVLRVMRSWVFVVVVAVAVGLLLAPMAWEATIIEPPTVAVVPVAGFIDGGNAQDINQRLVEARTDGNVEAVVLVVNSAGGTSAASEEVFIQVQRTADVKPVIAVIDAGGLSGGYKVAVPADVIIAKPASAVGSVGTTLNRPPEIGPFEPIIVSGPDKLLGESVRGYEYFVESASVVFLEHVMEHRGDALQVSEEEVAHARIYMGLQAAELGFVDELGDLQAGIQRAATVAEVDSYQVRVMPYSTPVQFLSPATYATADVPEKTMMDPEYFIATYEDPVVPTPMHVPAGVVLQMYENAEASTDAEAAENGTVVGNETVDVEEVEHGLGG